jgi:hypothetical protein
LGHLGQAFERVVGEIPAHPEVDETDSLPDIF